ncbi:hypothetical protein AB0E27_07945 [Streptomyces sparsogenes]|uniref:hypothetical protein n=1 Tax=Streptomyces sparsogenes TaxID=67365 RepID=UPI00341090A2
MSKRHRAAALLVTASCMTLLVASCDDDRFPHQYPKTDVNVSLEQVLHDHWIIIPKNAQDVLYSANSELEGYPLLLEFKAACSEMRVFSKQNKLTRLPWEKASTTTVAASAQELGWAHRAGDYGFKRDPGPTSKRVSVLVSPKGSVCHVWLDSWS